MPKGLFITFISLLFWHNSCQKKPVAIENIDYFYFPLIHKDKTIYHADSLAWSNQTQKAIDYFNNIADRYSGDFKNYINYRILSLQCDKDNFNVALYNNILISKNELKTFDFFKSLAIFDFDLKFDYRCADPGILLKHQKDTLTNFYSALLYNKLGEYYLFHNDNLKAKNYYQESEKLLSVYKKYSLVHLECFTKLIDVIQSKRELIFAKIYAERLLNFSAYSFAPDDVTRARQYNKIAFLSLGNNEIQNSLPYIWTAKKLLRNHHCTKEYHSMMINEFYYFLKKKSIYTLKSLYEIMLTEIDQCPVIYEDFHHLMAISQQKFNSPSASIPYFEKAIIHQISARIPDYINRTSVTNTTAFVYARVGKIDKALQTIALGNENTGPFKFKTFVAEHSKINTGDNGFIMLQTCADLYATFYYYTGKKVYLDTCKMLLDAGFTVMYRQMDVISEESILKYNEDVVAGYFDLAKKTIYELYKLTSDRQYMDQLLSLSDRSRNSVMARDIRISSNKDSLILEEQTLKKSFSLFKEAKSWRKASEIANKLFEINNKIKQNKELEDIMSIKSNVNYKQLHLDNETCILIIDELDDKLIINIITNKKHLIYDVTINPLIKEKWLELVDILINHKEIDPNNYASISYQITDFLFPHDEFKELKKNIYFIPDGIFHYLSPEVLAIKNTCAYKKFNEIPFLGDNHNIIYKFKLDLPSIKLSNKKINIAVFAFSDETSTSTGHNFNLPELPGSYNEAIHIKKIFPDAKIYVGTKATKKKFIEVYQDTSTDIIHLGLHGVSNDNERENVKLYFKNEDGGIDSLLGAELIGLKSNCSTIVLSACQSAKGKVESGEGIYSLPRYFIINGASNVLASLWDIDDNCGSRFFTAFYSNIGSEKKVNVDGLSLIKHNLKSKINAHPHLIYPIIICSR
ncbi:MAG: CHAT domain-containing protein [Saprospiraceae bacterium]|nr:CHAT domain-containing protein [Saprospiraceae bacterium]